MPKHPDWMEQGFGCKWDNYSILSSMLFCTFEILHNLKNHCQKKKDIPNLSGQSSYSLSPLHRFVKTEEHILFP